MENTPSTPQNIYVVPGWIDKEAKYSGIGCHIGRTYCGVFGYANELAIVSPTLFGQRQMIEICDEYASEMDSLFNSKSLNYYVIICY